MRVPHFLGDDDIRGQPHDGLSDDFLPRFVGADLPRAGGDLRGALEKENPAALYAGGIGGAIKQQNRPMVIRSVFSFSADKERNAAGCMSSPLGALKCVPLFLKGVDRFDKPEFMSMRTQSHQVYLLWRSFSLSP